MCELLVDVGTTYLKHELFDPESGTVRHSARRLIPQHKTPNPRDELDAARLLQETLSLVRSAEQVGVPVTAIRMSTQMHSFVLTSVDGEPLTPVITWRDRRTKEEEFASAVYEPIAARANGIWNGGQNLRPNLPVLKVLHLQREAPELFAGDPVALHTVGSFLNYHLTGLHFTHETNAVALGMFDQESGSWRTGDLAGATLPELLLPAVSRDLEPGGRHRSTGAVVYPDLGDQQAAYRSWTPGPEPAPVMVSVGTAGLVSVLSTRDQAENGVESRPYFDGRYLHTKTGLPGGSLLDSTPVATFADAVSEVCRDERRPLYITGGAAMRYEHMWSALSSDLGGTEVTIEERDASLLGLRQLAVERQQTARSGNV